MSRSIDELIEAAAELDERTAGLFERLAKITARATGDGIEVVVNLDGKLIGLDLTDEAMHLGAGALAAAIERLTQQASATALADGFAVLGPDDELLGL